MKKENLKRAIEINTQITKNSDQITNWMTAINYYNSEVQVSSTGSMWCRIKGVPFNIIKTLSIEAYRQENKELEQELLNLE